MWKLLSAMTRQIVYLNISEFWPQERFQNRVKTGIEA
jgi:hypothetical protein